MKAFWTLCVLQFLVALTLYFGDIGFDKAGKFGLDFDHFLLLMLVQGCLFVAAASMIIRRKRWILFSVQFLLLAITTAGVLLG
jgi:uncharacterized membrane protein YhaH (DUF805 family)